MESLCSRKTIYQNFKNLWFLESDWTYNGIFRPWGNTAGVQYKDDLKSYGGNLGKVITDAIAKVTWANGFRAGDTPTVLYLMDPNNDFNNPGKGSWAGRFHRPFPGSRPNFWTGINEPSILIIFSTKVRALRFQV